MKSTTLIRPLSVSFHPISFKIGPSIPNLLPLSIDSIFMCIGQKYKKIENSSKKDDKKNRIYIKQHEYSLSPRHHSSG